MLKTLLKKQLYELGKTMFSRSALGKKKASKGSTIVFALLMVYAYGVIAVMFYMMANSLCDPLVDIGHGWLYFALMGVMATMFGVVGSVFTAYSTLYKAKDNDLLLSLPIPPGMILFSRMVSVYIMTFVFEALVFIPTLIVYFISGHGSVLSAIYGVITLFILPLFGVVLSCVLGWLVAILSAFTRGKSKNFFTILLSLAFFFVYFNVINKANEFLQLILVNAEQLGGTVKTFLFPLYHMGLGAEGSTLSFILFASIILALFCVVYLALSKSFISVATANRGEKRVVYKEKKLSAASVSSALLRRELSHLTSSSVYMLNCALGSLMMLVLAVAAIIKAADLRMVFSVLPLGEGELSLIAVAAVAFAAAMNDLTAPSVSLEGKGLWIIRSLPVPTSSVLIAKLNLHVLLTAVPASVLTLSICGVLGLNALAWVLGLLFTISFTVLVASFGLVIGLKMPSLNWSSETYAVKQSMGVMVALFGSWGIVLAFVGLYFLLRRFLAPIAFLACAVALAVLVSTLLIRWIVTRGSRIFEAL